MRDGDTRCHALQNAPNGVNLLNLFGSQFGDAHAAMGDDLDQSFRCQCSNGFSHRALAHAKQTRNLVKVKALSGLEVSAQISSANFADNQFLTGLRQIGDLQREIIHWLKP